MASSDPHAPLDDTDDADRNPALMNDQRLADVDCPTFLQDDDPASEDAFGSHQRIAATIRDLIQSEPEGRVIGLVGSWGSGKSTVVRLLREGLAPNSADHPTSVFVFDAWMHQGDPLRRAFLEELITFLVDQEWTTRETWKTDLDRLTAKVEERVGTVEPTLRVPGALIAASFLFAPLGYTLMNGGSSWGLAIVLLPVFIATFTYLLWRPWPPLKRMLTRESMGIFSRSFWKTHRPPHERSSVLALFVQKTAERTEYTTVRTPDPTTLEFQEIFRRIVNRVTNNPARTLVVVMDNLDRVNTETAQTGWAALRAFLEGRHAHRSEGRNPLWLIVPYAPSGIGRALGQEESQRGERDESAADAFIEKNFDVTFRVPDPILADAKAFLITALEQALPSHTQDQFEFTYRVLAATRSGTSLTPRQAKRFVNHVASLHRMWGHQIPLEAIAMYVAYERRVPDYIAGARNRLVNAPTHRLLHPHVERMLDGELAQGWQRYVAALHFGAPPEKATQVWIGAEVERALAQADAGELGKLAAIPGFDEVCDRVLHDAPYDWASTGPLALAFAASVLPTLPGEPSVLRRRMRHLQQAAVEVKSWHGFDESAAPGFASIVRSSSAEMKTALLTSLLESWPRQPDEAEEGAQDGSADMASWTGAVMAIVEQLIDDLEANAVLSKWRIPGIAEEYVASAILCAERRDPDMVLATWIPVATGQEVCDAFAAAVQKNEFGGRHAQVVRALARQPWTRDWPWQIISSACDVRLRTADAIGPDHLVALISTIRALADRTGGAKDDALRSAFEESVNGGFLHHHLGRVGAKSPLASAELVLAILLGNGGAPPASSVGRSAAGVDWLTKAASPEGAAEKVFEEVAGIVRSEGLMSGLARIAQEHHDARPLFAGVLRCLAEASDGEAGLSGPELVESWIIVESSLPTESLVRIYGPPDSGVQSALAERDITAELVSLYELLLDHLPAAERSQLGAFLRGKFSALDKEKWLADLRGGRELVHLFSRVREGDPRIELRQAFHDALSEVADDVPEQQSSDAADSIVDYAQWLAPNWRHTLTKHLWDVCLLHGAGAFPNLWMAWRRMLVEPTQTGRFDEILRQVVVPLTESSSEGEIAAAAGLLAEAPHLQAGADPETVTTLRERVEGRLRRDGETASDALIQLAKALGLTPTLHGPLEQSAEDGQGSESSGDHIVNS